MKKCSQCGHNIEHFTPGVQIINTGGHRGLIPGESLARLLDIEYGALEDGQTRFIGMDDGESYSQPTSTLKRNIQ